MKTENKKPEKIKKTEDQIHSSILSVIRIAGEVKVKPDIKNTLYRLKLRRKYSCILINSKNHSLLGMLDKVRYHVAYGFINKETLIKLLHSRGKSIENKKFDSEKISDELISGKTLEELKLKPFFRLHPPRKGINSKLQYPKGVLGDNKHDINKLIERML